MFYCSLTFTYREIFIPIPSKFGPTYRIVEAMEKIDARFAALESSFEFLKKASEQSSSIAEIQKNVGGMDGIRELLAKFMKKQGISIKSPEEEEKC